MNSPPLEKVYIEVTTRCNLHCDMCIKYADGSCIPEGDFDALLMKPILPVLKGVKTVVLNGIGEPLLHPELEKIVAFCRRYMTKDGTIGFQSNGLLLSKTRYEQLLTAGLNTICFSLDTLSPSPNDHSAVSVDRALNIIASNKPQTFTTGLEVVISNQNIHELADIIQWAGPRVDYVLVSHLIPYNKDQLRSTLFSNHSSTAKEIFLFYQKEAQNRGLDLFDFPSARMKFKHSKNDLSLIDLHQRMQEEAQASDTHISLEIMQHALSIDTEAINKCFGKALNMAAQHSINLELPSIHGATTRNCRFLSENSCFINISGEVSPCHFLWHDYHCMAGLERIEVLSKSFGNIKDASLSEILAKDSYINFRKEAEKYDYPHCNSCSQGPCKDLVNHNPHGANDCYGSTVPCGHCIWNLGGVRCL